MEQDSEDELLPPPKSDNETLTESDDYQLRLREEERVPSELSSTETESEPEPIVAKPK